jgi:hypothetical protein
MQATQDLPGKLTDGFATALVLLLITLTLILMMNPVGLAYGNSGLFIYAIMLLAGVILCLERSIFAQMDQVTCARFGLAGGILGWMMITISSALGGVPIASITSLMILFLFGMVVFMLWRNLPLGVKFFLATLLLGALGHLLLNSVDKLAVWMPGWDMTLIAGYLYTLGAFLAMVRLFLFKGRSIDRTWAALALWFFLTMALSAFQGEAIL